MGARTALIAACLALAGIAGCGKASQASEDPAETTFAFVDVAPQAGVSLVNTSGDPRRWYILESNGNGAAWLDHDLDGDMDLFVGNGQGLVYEDGGRRLRLEATASSALYRNDTAPGGPLRFADVTAQSGAGRSEWSQALATGDVEGDGDTDLFLGNFGPDVLLVNEGGRFRDATEESGLGSPL